MIVDLVQSGTYIRNGLEIIPDSETGQLDLKQAHKQTITYKILSEHNHSGSMEKLKIKFDSLVSHDITYVSIIQTARASGMEKFPVPVVLSNCHNSLCAVGGTINADDHLYGYSAAEKYGGIFVPPHLAVIHQYAREMMSCCGSMILGSDSHTRYGALGTIGIGEGGGELVKQLLEKTYDIDMPEVIAVYLEGDVSHGVGPMDVALAIIKQVFSEGFVKNKVLEFVGHGVKNLSVDFRNCIDVMTTETACLSSIWMTDAKVEKYFAELGRKECYKELVPAGIAYYDSMVHVRLDRITPMIALPFHPSNVVTIADLNSNAKFIFHKVEKDLGELIGKGNFNINLEDKIKGDRVLVDQGVAAGCAGGTLESLHEMANILENSSIGCNAFTTSVYPASIPVYNELLKRGALQSLITAGVVIKTAFCGPCFGAGDTPSNGAISVRHATRNFPNREGSNPRKGQISFVALMDARSIAATAKNKGYLTGANEVEYIKPDNDYYSIKDSIYEKRVYNGFGKPLKQKELILGPNIKDWPKIAVLPDNLLLKVTSIIYDPVTTTDELIPSGESSSYRSDPFKMAEFTLSRKDPEYVSKAKKIQELESQRIKAIQKNDGQSVVDELVKLIKPYVQATNDNILVGIHDLEKIGVGSLIYAVKPGDGSAREQAASCQKILGGWANICKDYATKRYRSNLINWGIIPFTMEDDPDFIVNDYILITGIRDHIEKGSPEIKAHVLSSGGINTINLSVGQLTEDEKGIILSGCLINYYHLQKETQ